jgi:hypothetical protein
MTAWWIDEEATTHDEERKLDSTLAPWCRERIATLLQLNLLPNDVALLEAIARKPDAELDAQRRHWIRQMLWRYRRALPPDIRPKANPDDPIVREMMSREEPVHVG